MTRRLVDQALTDVRQCGAGDRTQKDGDGMTKQRTMARQPASIHAKIRRAPVTKPTKVVYRAPESRRSPEGSGSGAHDQRETKVSLRKLPSLKRAR
jgi:hypothetical protein